MNDFKEKKEGLITKDVESEDSGFKGKNFKNNYGKGKRKGKPKRWKGKITNAPSWHGADSQIVKDVGALPFNRMAGFKIDMFEQPNALVPGQTQPVAVTLVYLKTFIVDWFAGLADDFRSILNNASSALWAYIRKFNAGAINYQASDVFVSSVIGAVDVLCNLANAERFFKMADKYMTTNRLVPKIYFKAAGLDYEDFISHIADYRARLNIILARAKTLVIPKDFPIVEYAISQYTHIYKDRDSSTGREQMYMNIKLFSHIYDPTGSPQGGRVRLLNHKDLDPTGSDQNLVLLGNLTNNGPLVKFSFILDIIAKQLEVLITDQDVNVIFGDLLKAFGDGAFYDVAPLVTEIGTIDLEYSEEYLAMIHNGTCLPRIDDSMVNMVGDAPILSGVSPNRGIDGAVLVNTLEQDAQGYLVSKLMYHGRWTGSTSQELNTMYSNPVMLDSNNQSPDSNEVMQITRLVSRWAVDSVSETGVTPYSEFKPKAIGNLIRIDGKMYTGNVVQNTIVPVNDSQYLEYNDSLVLDPQEVVALMNSICDMSMFDWAPIKYIFRFDDSVYTGFVEDLRIHGDINNVTPITVDQLYRLNEADQLYLYNVPYQR